MIMRHTGIASVNDASAVKPDGSLLHLTSRHPHAVAGAFIQGTGCAYSPDAFYYADSFFFLPYWHTDPSKERKVGRESPRCGVEVFRTCVAILYYCFGPVLFFLVARTRMAREVAG